MVLETHNCEWWHSSVILFNALRCKNDNEALLSANRCNWGLVVVLELDTKMPLNVKYLLN